MKKLFYNLIWPAAAGNVAWAFFTVAVGEKWLDVGVGARLAVLILLAIYLAIDWIRMEEILPKLKSKFWIADAFHSMTIVVFAIATQIYNAPIDKIFLDWWLAAVFCVAAIGHLSGAWEPTGEVKKYWEKRFLLAGVNASGIGAIVILQYCSWNLPIALALVLTLWFPARYYVVPKWL